MNENNLKKALEMTRKDEPISTGEHKFSRQYVRQRTMLLKSLDPPEIKRLLKKPKKAPKERYLLSSRRLLKYCLTCLLGALICLPFTGYSKWGDISEHGEMNIHANERGFYDLDFDNDGNSGLDTIETVYGFDVSTGAFREVEYIWSGNDRIYAIYYAEQIEDSFTFTQLPKATARFYIGELWRERVGYKFTRVNGNYAYIVDQTLTEMRKMNIIWYDDEYAYCVSKNMGSEDSVKKIAESMVVFDANVGKKRYYNGNLLIRYDNHISITNQ